MFHPHQWLPVCGWDDGGGQCRPLSGVVWEEEWGVNPAPPEDFTHQVTALHVPQREAKVRGLVRKEAVQSVLWRGREKGGVD